MYNAYVVEIKELFPHSNADRLQIAKIFGLNVIVGLNVKVGDKMVYFPSDGQLSYDFADFCNLLRKKDSFGNNIGGYMDPQKRNVKAIKLRGEYSDGILIPIDKLTDFLGVNNDFFDVGFSFNTVKGIEICKKYVPKTKNNAEKTNKNQKKPKYNKYPLFYEHKDTLQLAYNEANIHPGDKLTVSLKLHGTSGRSSYTKVFSENTIWNKIKRLFLNKKDNEYEYALGTRRTFVEEDEGGFYGSNVFRKEQHNRFIGKLHKGETVYYEIVGYTDTGSLIMPPCDNKKLNDKDFVEKYGDTTSFTYGCKPYESEIYVYRMSITNEDGIEVDYSTDQTKLRCEQMGVNHVPILCTYVVTDRNKEHILDTIKQIADGQDLIDSTHIREGIVVRIENRLSFTAYKHKSMDFKILEGIIKENAELADMEEQEGQNI